MDFTGYGYLKRTALFLMLFLFVISNLMAARYYSGIEAGYLLDSRFTEKDDGIGDFDPVHYGAFKIKLMTTWPTSHIGVMAFYGVDIAMLDDHPVFPSNYYRTEKPSMTSSGMTIYYINNVDPKLDLLVGLGFSSTAHSYRFTPLTRNSVYEDLKVDHFDIGPHVDLSILYHVSEHFAVSASANCLHPLGFIPDGLTGNGPKEWVEDTFIRPYSWLDPRAEFGITLYWVL